MKKPEKSLTEHQVYYKKLASGGVDGRLEYLAYLIDDTKVRLNKLERLAVKIRKKRIEGKVRNRSTRVESRQGTSDHI